MQAPAVPQPSDQQLQRFASASQKVSGVVDEYRPKVESAKTDEAKQKLVKEADEKMVQLVRADGLTVDEFNGISRAVQQDPQLQQRVSKLNPSGRTRCCRRSAMPADRRNALSLGQDFRPAIARSASP